MKITITEFERVACVPLKDGGRRLDCPKCNGACYLKDKSDKGHRHFDCRKCGRGWTEVPNDIKTVSQAHAYFEELTRQAEQQQVSQKICPDCGKPLRLIESTEADGTGEFKDVMTCDNCSCLLYIIRQIEGGPFDPSAEEYADKKRNK